MKVYRVFEVNHFNNSESGVIYYSSKAKALKEFNERYDSVKKSECYHIIEEETIKGNLYTKMFTYKADGYIPIKYTVYLQAHDVY